MSSPIADPATSPATGQRPIIVWDLILSIVLILIGIVIDIAMSFAGLFLAFASDSCSSQCNLDQLSAGMMIAMIGPSVVFVAAIIVAIVTVVKRRIAFWIPIAGIVLALVVWGIGAAMAFSAVPGFFG